MKLSIIIPVYNAAPYIERCLDSVLRQDIDDYEVIAINDGSTDDSLAIMERYKEASPVGHRLKILTQENRGVSATRNRGIDEVLGEYITFVDADDYLDDGILGKVLSKLEESHRKGFSPDLVSATCKVVHRSGSTDFWVKYDSDEFIESMPSLYPIEIAQNASVWGKLYKRKIILENKLRFDDKIKIGEDAIFNLRYFVKCKSYLTLSDLLYNYILNTENATSRFYGESVLTDTASFIENAERYYANPLNCDLDEVRVKQELNRHIAFNYYSIILSVYRNKGIKQRRYWLRRYWGAASEYDNRWSYQLDSGIPKITAMLGRQSLSLAHCWLRTIFTIERLKNKIKNIK